MGDKSKARVELPLSKKAELIKMKENTGKSNRVLADIFGIGRTQVGSILKRKAEVLCALEENVQPDKKRVKYSHHHEDVDKLTWEWFQRARALSIPLTGPLIQSKACEFAKQLGHTDFKGSNGWLERFKSRHSIACSAISGERGDVDSVVVDNWRDRLPEICSGYEARNIWNMDETGLVFRALPDRTLCVRGSDCAGGKKSKERLTVSLACNMEGEFDKPLVIGKAAKPRAFRNIDTNTQLPVVWKHNKKSWMTSALFCDWLNDFNKKMKNQGRHVLLFLDNAPAHPHNMPSHSNVKLIFFPANTTSVLQPLDQGIIRAMKLNYRKRLLTRVVKDIDKGLKASAITKGVDVLNAVYWIKEAVNQIKSSTVAKCFQKAGFNVTTTDEDEDPEENIPLAQLLQQVSDNLDLDQPITNPDSYATVDDDLPSSESRDADWEENLVKDFLTKDTHEPASDYDEEIDTKPTPEPKKVNYQEVLEMMATVKNYCLDNGLHLWEDAAKLESGLESQFLSVMAKKEQTKINSYFKAQ